VIAIHECVWSTGDTAPLIHKVVITGGGGGQLQYTVSVGPGK